MRDDKSIFYTNIIHDRPFTKIFFNKNHFSTKSLESKDHKIKINGHLAGLQAITGVHKEDKGVYPMNLTMSLCLKKKMENLKSGSKKK